MRGAARPRLCTAAMAAAFILMAMPAQAQDVTSLEAFQARSGSSAPTAGAPAPRRAVLNCTIRPSRTVEVASIINGVIAEVLVRPGQTVASGEPVARLDTTLLEADLAVARGVAGSRAALGTAMTRRDGAARREARLREAFERNAVSEAEYEDAALQLALAQNAVTEQQERLRQAATEVARIEAQIASATIRALVGGVVGEGLIDPGEGTQGRPIATIYVNDPLRVEVYVPTSQITQVIEAERHAIVLPDRAPGVDEHPVTLDYAAQVGDAASNTISVFFTLDAPEVLAGSRCTMPAPGGEI